MNAEEKKAACQQVRDYIRHAGVGTQDYHRNALMRSFVHTDGVAFMADKLGAHWLIDLIASHQTNPKVRAEGFQVWKLHAPSIEAQHPDHWRATCCADDPGPEIVHQDFEYSDFPEELAPFTLWVEDSADSQGNRLKVLLLPAEH
jgi:hypothetical protein